MAVAYQNGHSSNGHNKVKQLTLQLAEPTALCCERVGHGSWCLLPDKHLGDHEGVPPVYGPVEERPSLWRISPGRVR
jgi:hypothetical protein